MASSQAELSNQQQQPQHRTVQAPGAGYVPSEEERRVFRECNNESFWYRSVPFSAVGMVVTQGLISKGFLTSSARFGSVPKVIFAGMCGYLAGKISYMKVCQEKFKKLENSPLGEALRQGLSPSSLQSAGRTSEFSEGGYGNTPPPSAGQSSVETQPLKYSPTAAPFSSSFSESSTTGITDGLAQEPAHFEEEIPKQRKLTYDELRSKNRETFEIAASQRADTPVRPSLERTPRKDAKTNKYGDIWEE
ncbi:OCIA domain-containing protein 1 [Pelobates fuscus]|uniref:OCIA domain-containing protein 1 n=1 Tax=Pelobates fuscus TaxID=191477 RepID=UPI002FE4541F